LGTAEVNYGYRYSLKDLRELKKRTLAMISLGVKPAYVMFNNINVLEDAASFSRMPHSGQGQN
jgi:uncharacterized protein YecE (DUF72 family)